MASDRSLTGFWVYFGVLGLCLWIGASIGAGTIGNSDLFQRLGSIGIVSSIILFLALRWREGVTPPPGYHDINHLHDLRINQNSVGALNAHKNISLLAAGIVLQNRKEGIATNKVIASLAEAVLSDPAQDYTPATYSEHEVESARVHQRNVSAARLVHREKVRHQYFEATFLALSSLQWGFGDWILNWARSG